MSIFLLAKNGTLEGDGLNALALAEDGTVIFAGLVDVRWVSQRWRVEIGLAVQIFGTSVMVGCAPQQKTFFFPA